ncbi:MAG: bifunctional folylpolyglutamate synthase/dihydrofolate synthase [Planctomycetes bacterium]|nr:bifunctional folylpolyglutamate synthase/dihydrofolate synthase [Planctomycetota bacterium]
MGSEDLTMGASSPELIEVMRAMDRLVNWERRDRTADMGRTLEPVRDLLRRLGEPQRGPRFVHVAGTKGKGSVSAIVAAALGAAGVRCGCYASPHVERVTERVRIDGGEVDEGSLAKCLSAALRARELAEAEGTAGGAATWFDLFTAGALRSFADAACEWVVLECGLGGRLDSTNAVDGEVCALTNVDFEHTAVLGDTLRAITLEKAAITPTGGVLVVGLEEGDGEVCVAVREVVAEVGARARFLEQLPETFDGRNEATARAILEEVEAHGGPAGVASFGEEVVLAARQKARCEHFAVDEREVILDGGHVASSVRGLLSQLEADGGAGGSVEAVLALGREKDAASVLKALAGHVDRLHCTTSMEGPLATGEDLARLGRELGIDARDAGAPSEALEAALGGSAARVLVLGSFYLAGELRPLLVARAEHSDACSPSSQTSSSRTLS